MVKSRFYGAKLLPAKVLGWKNGETIYGMNLSATIFAVYSFDHKGVHGLIFRMIFIRF
ncbi:hypothetical protein [Zymomonas sp.]|uniref:hypothetical protein n=1 Tax=Zymomonas sp. TaxID=2068624 RepID=UPI0025FF91B3|nr:hypothetical protein [Zymomonas sp.]MCA1956376.1 hypothetical protein [Zymomonas sp.]